MFQFQWLEITCITVTYIINPIEEKYILHSLIIKLRVGSYVLQR